MLISVNGHHYITYFNVHLVLNDVVAMKDLNAIRKKGKGKKTIAFLSSGLNIKDNGLNALLYSFVQKESLPKMIQKTKTGFNSSCLLA